MTDLTYSFRVLWSEEDAAYVAVCPEFPGLSGLGDSPEAALAEAQAALRLAVETHEAEGWPLPAAEALKEFSGQFRLRVPRTLHARLVQRAEDDGVSLNTLAVSLLASGVGESTVRARPPLRAVSESARDSAYAPHDGESPE